MSRQHGPLDELVRLLWGSGCSARLLPLHEPVPGGHVVVERVTALPSVQRPRLLVSLDAPETVRALLLGEHQEARRTHLARRRSGHPRTRGVEPLMMPGGTDVKVVLPAEEAGLTLRHLAATNTGCDPASMLTCASIEDAPGECRPIVTLADLDGRARLSLEVASQPVHRHRLSQQYAALNALRDVPASGVRTPEPLFSAEWQGHQVLGTAALPAATHPVTVNQERSVRRHLDTLQASQPMSLARLADSAWWAQLRGRANAVPETLRAPLGSQFARLTTHFGEQYYAWGRVHGDWVPANMAWCPDGNLSVRGWEHSHPQGPLLFDALHWRLAVVELVRGGAAPHGVRALRHHVAGIGAAPPGLAAVFLAEQAVRRAEEMRPEAPATREVATRALRALAETDVIED